MHPGFEGGAHAGHARSGCRLLTLSGTSILPLTYQAHVASFLCEGVFEKFPGLKVMLVEGGIGWLPSLLWRMDKDYKALRSTRRGSNICRRSTRLEHIRLSSQPLEEPPRPEQLLQLFEMIHAERTLCFASDFPHWDFDDPLRAFPHRMPVELKQRILYENAAELYGLPSLEESVLQCNPQSKWSTRFMADYEESLDKQISTGFGSESPLDFAFRVAEEARPPKRGAVTAGSLRRQRNSRRRKTHRGAERAFHRCVQHQRQLLRH
jgi:hypothetical protein